MTSLFLGLCKAADSLKPYSSEFANGLGYRVFAIEPSFPLIGSGRVCNPDLIVGSSTLGHTLLLEWTSAASPNEKKKDQLLRYAQVSTDDLVEMAHIPRPSSDSCDTLVAVLEPAAQAFATLLHSLALDHTLVKVDCDTGFKLAHHFGTVCSEATQGFFKRGIELEFVPVGYASFSLPITSKSVEKLVAVQLTSLIAQDRRTILHESLCRGAIPEFNLMGQAFQRQVTERIAEVLSRVERDTQGVIVSRSNVKGQPKEWKLLERDEYMSRKSHAHYLDRLAAGQTASDTEQGGLFDSLDE